jgi:hypothetical protein
METSALVAARWKQGQSCLEFSMGIKGEIYGVGSLHPRLSSHRGNLVRINAHPARASNDLLTSTTSLGDGFIPAANSARWCSFNVGCLHSSFKLCQGLLWYPARSNRLWIRFRPPHHDSGMFPLTLYRLTSDSRMSRTRWPTIRIMSNLDRLAVMYVRYSTRN